MRKEFEMSEEQLKEILDACKPVRCMMIGNVAPESPQENANRAWGNLGNELKFDYLTVRPVSGKGNKFFTAEITKPNELLNGAEVMK